MFPLAAATVRLGRVVSVNELLFRLGRVVSTFQDTPFKGVIQRKDLLSQPLSELVSSPSPFLRGGAYRLEIISAPSERVW